MQTRGALIRQAPGTYEVVDLEVDDPRENEVQVKLVASGLCHSDDHVATGDIPVGVYPFAGGHVIERHARPGRGVHALQIELDRRTYLDPTLKVAGAGFDKGALLMEALAVELGTSLLGRQYATAAE